MRQAKSASEFQEMYYYFEEIPESADESEVKSMFDDCPQKYQSIIYGLNGSWYITFATEEDTRLAFIHLQNLGKTFNDKPVHARIKTGGAPVTTTESTNGQIIIHDQYIGKSICESMDYSSPKMDTLNSYNLGLILAQFGYVPRCTFRPTQPSMKDGNGGNVSVNVPISIHTDWHNGSEIDHQLSSGTHLPTNISADHIIGDHGTKENVQPSNHYSITTTSTTTNTAKKLILDSSATKGAGLVQQSAYDGFLLTNTPVSNYGMIPNFGRQRITDVPRMNNKNGASLH
uniref:LARP4/4B RNA recognition motif domain-containing protein n=1 Tax=Ditylenchus dipsaci TaxID=166011 RepID=A0A915DFP8_9BILA